MAEVVRKRWRVVAGVVGSFWGAVGCGAPNEPPELVAPGRISLPPPPPAPPAVAPLAALTPIDTAPATGASPLAGAAVDARVLVITAGGNSTSFGALENTLEYLGTPFDVLNAATGPVLTADMLAAGGHGRYDAVFLDVGDLSGAFTDAEWVALTTYEVVFGVRRVSLYTSPSASYGLIDTDAGIDPTRKPISATCTPAGAAVFVGTNCANPIVINQGYAYSTTPIDGATIPLLVDTSGSVYAATRSYPDGREALALTFGQASTYVSYLELAYGLVNWATRGLFIGERHVYAVPQIDDLFLASAIYTGGTYRLSDADLQSFATWESVVQAAPLTAGFRATFCANGYGASIRPGDPLAAKAVALGPAFEWINHTWDHPVLDTLGYADALNEFSKNDRFLRGLGLMPYATINAVTPNVSGLGSADAMRAIHDAGIEQIVSDTSVPGQNNPTPNAGIWNALQPTVLEIPRKPTDLYFNVSQPVEWIPEYAALHMIAAPDYSTLQGLQSDALSRYMLDGSTDPWMFHQANARDYDGEGHSLLSDLLDATFAKYGAVMTFPVISPTMDDLATRVRNRMALDGAGVVATVAGGALTVTVAHAATVPVTGLCTPGAERYGGQTISYLTLGDGQSATYPLDGCAAMQGSGDMTSADSGAPPVDAAGSKGAPSAADAGGSTTGATITAGTPGNHVETHNPSPLSGCGCALGAGDPGVNVTALWLVGGALLGRGRRARA